MKDSLNKNEELNTKSELLGKENIMEKVDINKMSKEINVDEQIILEILGLSPVMEEVKEASNVEEAAKAFKRALNHSESADVALDKWNTFSMEEVEKASNLEEAKKALVRAPNFSKSKKAAIIKISKFFVKK